MIAGEALGARAVIDTRTPIVVPRRDARARRELLEQPLPEDFNAFAYVVEGAGLFGAKKTAGAAARARPLRQRRRGRPASRPAGGAPLRALLIAGRPLDEPVARAGPFVMNTRAEVVQAFEDFQQGRLG